MFVILVCLVLAAFSSGADASLGPSLYSNYHGEYAAAYDNYIPKPYAFEYGVSDPHTGDHKSQWETKDEAGVVRGSYSLLESDGSTRIVDYIADDHGFRAVVKKIGIHGHPESIQSHGGEEIEAPLISPIVVAEPGPIQVPELASGPVHVNYETPLPVEAGPLYHSYDGGLEHYQNLYNTQPLPFSVPKAQGIYVDLPKHQAVPQTYNQIHLGQPNEQQHLFAPNQGQPYVPQSIIASKIDNLEPQYGPSLGGGYQVPQYSPQSQEAPIPYQGHQQYPVQHQGVPEGGLPVDNYRLELAYGEPQGLGAPKLVLGGQELVNRELVGPAPSSYAHDGNALQPQARYAYVQDYGQDGGLGDLGLNQGEYLPPGSLPVGYKGLK